MAPLTSSTTSAVTLQPSLDANTPLAALINATSLPPLDPHALDSQETRTHVIKQKWQAFEDLLARYEELPQALQSAVARLRSRANDFIEGARSGGDDSKQVAAPRSRTMSADQDFEMLKDAFDTITVTVLETTRPINRPF
ncbi:hypothetical protein OIV83_003879 [Microbotryomycetes sp. JL201]|nr:hypothetical protein OIV83_003879 [Microbotryomycetes sp. JL201]